MVDHHLKVRVKSVGTGVDVANVKMSMDTFDEIAEKAGRPKEADVAMDVIAVLANLPQANFASKVVVADGNATVSREVDGGAEARSLTLLNIMKAKEKPLETVTPEDLGVDVTPRLKTVEAAEPLKRSAGVKCRM